MGNEGIIIGILGILLGLVIGYILFVKTKILNKFIKNTQKDIINDPRKLKELLEKNGTFVEDGKEIVFKIGVNDDRKEILIQETKEIQKPKREKEAKPKKQAKTKKKTKKK